MQGVFTACARAATRVLFFLFLFV